MDITKNFSLHEFVYSSVAEKYGIDNTPDETVMLHIVELVETLLQPLRDAWGSGISVNSGYRCPELNSHKEIGGSPTSAHAYGYAADIKPSNGDMKSFQEFVLGWFRNSSAKFDQLIFEKPKNGIASWLHIGVRNRNGAQRGQIFTIQ